VFRTTDIIAKSDLFTLAARATTAPPSVLGLMEERKTRH
jgi:hypothetical protein